jgi:excisionase family DNA binding protein
MSRNDRKDGAVEDATNVFTERHLSLKEAQAALGVSERTIHRWIKSGKLKSYKPGRDHRIPESAIRKVVEESEVYPKQRGLLSAEWALSLADEDTFQQAITNALSQDLRSLVVDLVGNYQPRLFEDVRGVKPSPEDVRRVRAFMRAYSIAEVLQQRGEEAPESYILALRRHMDAMTSPEAHHPQESQETA